MPTCTRTSLVWYSYPSNSYSFFRVLWDVCFLLSSWNNLNCHQCYILFLHQQFLLSVRFYWGEAELDTISNHWALNSNWCQASSTYFGLYLSWSVYVKLSCFVRLVNRAYVSWSSLTSAFCSSCIVTCLLKNPIKYLAPFTVLHRSGEWTLG